jgi:hypothetical protein
MKAKGKHGKVIMVAVMSKLIRQMWAMVTTNQVVTVQPLPSLA